MANVAFLSRFYMILFKVFRGEIMGRKRGNFNHTHTNNSEHLRTIKKARRLGTYCISTVNTYLLALIVIVVEMRNHLLIYTIYIYINSSYTSQGEIYGEILLILEIITTNNFSIPTIISAFS